MTTDTTSRERRPRLLDRALYRMFMREVVVSAVEPLAPRFRLIELSSESLGDATGIAGQKLQVALGSAFTTRTYTPMELGGGRIRVLAFAHGMGPASAWGSTARQGDICHIYGPRQSLDLSRVSGTLLMIGDETSIGLSSAMAAHRRDIAIHHLFEVEVVGAASAVLNRMGIANAEIHRKRIDDGHLPTMEAQMAGFAREDAHFVLTGKASTIQRLRHALRRIGVPTARILTKAYWAPGKTGLD
jgi:NADPH-dependent ferric siderophore reductase